METCSEATRGEQISPLRAEKLPSFTDRDICQSACVCTKLCDLGPKILQRLWLFGKPALDAGEYPTEHQVPP